MASNSRSLLALGSSLRSDFGLSVLQEYESEQGSHHEHIIIGLDAHSSNFINLEQSSTNCPRSTTSAGRSLPSECRYQPIEILKTNVESTSDTTSSPFQCLASLQGSPSRECLNSLQHNLHVLDDVPQVSCDTILRVIPTCGTSTRSKQSSPSALPLSRPRFPIKKENTNKIHIDEVQSGKENSIRHVDLCRRHSTGQTVRSSWICGRSRSPPFVNQWLDKVEEIPKNLERPKSDCDNDSSIGREDLPNLRTALKVCEIELPHTMALLHQLGIESSSGNLRRAKTFDGNLISKSAHGSISGKARALRNSVRQCESDCSTKPTAMPSEHKVHAPITREKLQRRASRSADPKYEQLMRRLISSRIITQKPLEVKLTLPERINDISLGTCGDSSGESCATKPDGLFSGQHTHRRAVSQNQNYGRPRLSFGGPIKPVRIPACFSAC